MTSANDSGWNEGILSVIKTKNEQTCVHFQSVRSTIDSCISNVLFEAQRESGFFEERTKQFLFVL
jgi:hypothetical protein